MKNPVADLRSKRSSFLVVARGLCENWRFMNNNAKGSTLEKGVLIAIILIIASWLSGTLFSDFNVHYAPAIH